jgi:amidase
MSSSWESKAADKKSRLKATIPQEWRLKSLPTEENVMGVPKSSGILTADELAITESTAVDLVSEMAAGKLTSVAVTTAFCKRAALAHQLVGCKTSIIRMD